MTKKEEKSSPLPWSAHMLGGGKGGPNAYTIRSAGDDGTGTCAVAVCRGGGESHLRGWYNGANAHLIVRRVNQGPDFDAMMSTGKELEKARGRMRDHWSEAVNDAPFRRELWSNLHAAGEAFSASLKLAQEVR